MNVVIRNGPMEWEVAVDADPDATVADLAASLMVEKLGLDGEELPPGTPLAAIASGSVLEVDGKPEHGADGEVRLSIVAGAGSGSSVSLPAGEYIVGGGEAANVIIPDRGLETSYARLTISSDGHSRVRLVPGVIAEIEGKPLRLEAALPDGALLRLGSAFLTTRHLREGDPSGASPPRRGLVVVSRPPRMTTPGRVPAVTLPPEPTEPQPPGRFRWATVIAPIVIGAGLALLFSPLMLMFAVLGPVMVAANWYEDRSRARKQRKEGFALTAQGLDRMCAELDTAIELERAIRFRTHPDIDELLRRVRSLDRRIWERRPAHPDFMQLLAGYGNVDWRPEVVEPHGPALRGATDRLARRARLLAAPVAIDLGPGRLAGLSGSAARAGARHLVMQAAIHHGPADLQIGVITDDAPAWDWVKWLPHATEDSSAGTMLAGTNEAEIADFVELLAADQPADPAHVPLTLLVVDVDRIAEPRHAPIRDLLAAPGRPLAAIVVGDDVPSSSTVVLHCDDAGDASVTFPEVGSTVLIPVLAEEEASLTASRGLAPLVDPDLRADTADLPDEVRLLDVLDLESPSPAGVLARWREADPAKVSACIGSTARGPLEIDLVTDGPHGLLAGTTGSGKSELLRTLVASLAATYDPSALNFVLIDYKGGSAFDVCADLPHTVGLVTDLDAHLGERALVSLEAELRHRETRLRADGVDDIAEHLTSRPDMRLPRLLVVVDEFAALARELPDFVAALVDIAQRGRSLGVHLLLATQRPSGVVSDNIRANTNIRIALRVQHIADSTDVLGHGGAASIGRRRPGRGFVRLGPGETVPFQAALVTSNPSPDDGARVTVTPFVLARERPVAEAEAVSTGPSDLGRLAAAIGAAACDAGIAEPRKPWIPPLPDLLTDADLPSAETNGSLAVAVGMLDDPFAQRQVPYDWDRSLIAYGVSGSGTTTLLKTIAQRLAATHSPSRVHIYALDFDSQTLVELEGAPHVGSVVGAHEPERQRRLLRFLDASLERRRRAAAEGSAEGRPAIVVLVDDYSGLKAAVDEWGGHAELDAFHRIVGEGSSFGIFVVLVAKRATAVPSSVAALVPERIVFRLADPSEYSGFGLFGRALPNFRPGRAIHVASGHELQVILPAPVQPSSKPVDGGPPEIGVLPSEVKTADVVEAARVVTEEWRLPVGIGDDRLAPVGWGLHESEHALIAGPPRSGKSTCLAAIAECVGWHRPELRIVAFTPRSSPLQDSPFVDRVGGVGDLRPVVETSPGVEILVLIDDAELIGDDDGLLRAMLTERAGPLRAIAAGNADALRTSFGHWTEAVRRDRNGLALVPNPDSDGDLWRVQLPRRGPDRFPPGRGYLIDSGRIELVQAARI